MIRFLASESHFFARIKEKADFIFLCIILILLNIPYWDPALWTENDSIYVFHVFYSYYNEFFFNQDLLRWFPYGMYGMRGDYFQPNYLSFANYFAILVGGLLRIKDVLLVFKWSELIEQLILLTGTYLLCGKLFKSKLTSFLISISVIGSSIWYIQIFWNFRTYYALPLILSFLFTAFRGGDLKSLFVAGIVWISSLFGIPAYHGIFQFLIFLLFTPLLLVYRPWNGISDSLRNFRNDKTAMSLFLIFILISMLYVYVQVNLYESIEAQVYARDPLTHKTPLKEFLTYGENTEVSKYLGLIFAGLSESMYYTIYLGFFPLIFLIFSVMTVRSYEFAVFSAVTFFIALFSLGDSTFLARTIYEFFPPIQYFRYIGGVHSIFRIFLIVTAGFGIDFFLQNKKEDFSKKIFAWSGIGFIIAALFLDWLNGDGKLYSKQWPNFFYFSLLLTTILVTILAGKTILSEKSLKAILIGFFLFEIFSYQNLVLASWPAKWDWASPEVRKVFPYEYQPRRTFDANLTPRIREATKVVESINDQFAVETYSFIQYDPCIPLYLKIYEPVGLSRLIDLRARVLRTNFKASDFYNDPQIPVFLKTIGCNYPKMRLVSDVHFADGLDQAGVAVRDIPNIDETIVVRDAPQALRSQYRPEKVNPDAIGKIEVEEFGYNGMTIRADVRRENGVFLYYADSYHPGWKAALNGQKTPIFEANLAFKALYIPQGVHTIKMNYFNEIPGVASYAVAIAGILFILAFFYFLIRKIV